MHTTASAYDMEQPFEPFESTFGQIERWGALAAAAALIGFGVSRRSVAGLCLAAGAAPLAYRGVTGQWPVGLANLLGASDDSRSALSGSRGINLRESVRLECPVEEIYRFWIRLENLPTFMNNLISVTDLGGGRSHWVARGPGDVPVEWDAEIINQIPNKVLAWRSLPGGDVVSAGSVTFQPARGEDRSTQVTVTLQYQPPAGKVGAFVAKLFGREPQQTIREDLRRFKQLLEAGETAKAAGTPGVPAGAGR
jgi:uncharacterized membrane protein